MGAPVYWREKYVVGFVSYIPKGQQKGKPIIITDMIAATVFINQYTNVVGSPDPPKPKPKPEIRYCLNKGELGESSYECAGKKY